MQQLLQLCQHEIYEVRRPILQGGVDLEKIRSLYFVHGIVLVYGADEPLSHHQVEYVLEAMHGSLRISEVVELRGITPQPTHHSLLRQFHLRTGMSAWLNLSGNITLCCRCNSL